MCVYIKYISLLPNILMDLEIVYLAILSLAVGFHYGNHEWLKRTIHNQFLKDHINWIIRTLLVLTLLIVAPTYIKLTILGLITGILGGYEGKKSYEQYQKSCDMNNLKQQQKEQEQNFIIN